MSKNKMEDLWWEINEEALTGSGIDRKNGEFMSTSNNHTAGTLYQVDKNLFGNIESVELYATAQSMAQAYEGFPTNIVTSGQSPASYHLKSTKDISLGASIMDNLLKKLGTIEVSASLADLTKATTVTVQITEWGFDNMEELGIDQFMAQHEKTLKKLDNIKHLYVANKAVWIKGINFNYSVDRSIASNISASLNDGSAPGSDDSPPSDDSTSSSGISGGVNFKLANDTTFSASLNFNDKFYPFLRFSSLKP